MTTPIHPNPETLRMAAAVGDAVKLRAQLDAGVDIDAHDNWGETALMAAASGGSLDCLVQLISARARLDIADRDGHTAAMLAAWSGRELCLRALVDAGVNLGAKDHKGRSASELAALNDHAGLAVFLEGAARSREESAEIRRACDETPPSPSASPRVRV